MESEKEDFSADSTIVPFTHPLPLLRIPIKCSSSTYPFTIAFPNADSFYLSFDSAKSKIIKQCEDGVRMGCALTAAERCRPSWWRTLTRDHGRFKSREECEEREMAFCIHESMGNCSQFGIHKSFSAFRDARVASSSHCNIAMGLISCVFMKYSTCLSNFNTGIPDWWFFMFRGANSYRGSVLLG